MRVSWRFWGMWMCRSIKGYEKQGIIASVHCEAILSSSRGLLRNDMILLSLQRSIFEPMRSEVFPKFFLHHRFVIGPVVDVRLGNIPRVSYR